MQFLYNTNAKDSILEITDEAFLHLKAQRKRIGDTIKVQNLKDNTAYFYEISNIKKNYALLELKNKQILPAQNFPLKLGWAVCDEKTIEKTLPALNELGLGELVLFYADFSQKNIKLDNKRFERILLSSSQQCGRYEMMKISLIKANELKSENCILLDFNAKTLLNDNTYNLIKNKLILVGPEGGFSALEREKFQEKISLKCNNILRSNTAITCLCAKILT